LLDGSTDIQTKSFTISQRPILFQEWKKDSTICPGNTIDLNPYPNGAPSGMKYIWYPKGDTTQVLRVDSAGCYSVEVINQFGCSTQDRINVKVCLEPAGQEGAKWYFGENAGLDFAGGMPEPLTDGKLNTPEGTSSIANSIGELQFYTDGIFIFDKNGTKMPCMTDNCADSLAGSPNSTQSVLIVPQPTCKGCEYLFNVFTTKDVSATEKHLSVTVVDMRRNNGNGAIVEQNTLLHNNTTERLVSSRNDADSTYWVITHDYGNNTFRVYHATTGGLSESGVYNLGQAHDTESKGEGQMKFSSADSTGKRTLAVVVPGPPENFVELFSFNDEDGKLEYKRTISLGPAPPKAYGVEFSPDQEKLYVSLMGQDGASSKLIQYDLSIEGDSLLQATALVIDSSATDKFGSLQIAPDGKIYMAIDGSEYLAVIGAPDQTSLRLLEYERRGVHLGGKKSKLGLPNFVQNFTENSDGPGAEAEGFCAGSPTTFTVTPLCQPLKDQYTWDFGDGKGVIYTDQTEYKYTYEKPGKYQVTLRAVNQCKDTTFVYNIEILATPEPIDLGPDKDECRTEIALKNNVQAEHYFWIFNNRIVGQEPEYKAKSSGMYVAIAANGPQAECYQMDTIMVRRRIPPAFTLGPDTTMCNDSSIVLRAVAMSYNQFKWSTGETTREITVRQPGVYWVEVQNEDCYNGDTLTVVSRPKARVTALLTPPTGCTTADGSIRVTGLTPSGVYQYSWLTIDSTVLGNRQEVTGLREGSYLLRVSGNLAACTTDTSFALRSPANPLRLSPLITDASCTQPDSGHIALSIQGGNPTQFVWRNAQGAVIGNTNLLDNLEPGVYSLQARDQGGCTFEIPSITVGLTKDNLANLGPDRVICIGDTVHLQPYAVNFRGNQYIWSTGESTPSIVVDQEGNYTLQVLNNENGCNATDAIFVKAAAPPAVTLVEENPLCVADNDEIQLQVRGSSNYLYYWPQLEDSAQIVKVNRIGTYYVMVTDPQGCTIEKATEVVDKCEPHLFVPDIFTPNKDGHNDTFRIFGRYFTDLEVKVYNRWGEVIFASDNIDQEWDGTYRNAQVPPGIYAYKITYKSLYFPERESQVKRGAIAVFR
jgi:gliding motility-associated-like protein